MIECEILIESSLDYDRWLSVIMTEFGVDLRIKLQSLIACLDFQSEMLVKGRKPFGKPSAELSIIVDTHLSNGLLGKHPAA